jgi:hypothetical protein
MVASRKRRRINFAGNGGKLIGDPWVSNKSNRMKFVTLQVSKEFKVPRVYAEGGAKEVEEALQVGAWVQEHVKTRHAAEDLKELAARKDAEISALEEQLASLQEEVAAAESVAEAAESAAEAALQQQRREAADALKEARRQERETVQRETEFKLATAEREVEAAKQRLALAEDRRRLLETERDADIRAAQEKTKEMMQQVVAVREEQVRSANAALAVLEGAYEKQQEELRALNDFLRRRQQNVKVKGNDYEAEFREALVRAFGTADRFALTETAKNGVGHAGDFLMRLNHAGNEQTVLWEVKNYDKPVPKAEVDKFQRDVKENKNVLVGVMVSRYTDIVGKVSRGDRDMEFFEGKLLLYLSRFESQGDEVVTLQALVPLFRIWWEVVRDEEESAHLEDTIRELERLLADLTRRRQEWRVHKMRMEDTLRWMSECVEDSEIRVERLLKQIQSGHAATEFVVPEGGPFRPVQYDERIRDTVALLLERYEVSPVAEVKLNDLCEVVAAAKKMGRDTARKYVLAALADSAVVAAPGKPTLVRGLTPLV